MVSEKIKSFFIQCTRVWSLLKRPSIDEFKKTSTVSAIGLGIIGLLGFGIAIIMSYIFPK